LVTSGTKLERGIDIEIHPMSYTRLLKKSLFCCLILTSRIAEAQYAFIEPDKNFKYSYRAFSDSLDISRPDFRDIDLEIRIWMVDHLGGENTVVRLRRAGDSEWVCLRQSFDYLDGDESYVRKNREDTFRLKPTWNQAWTSIVDQHYLHLPDQRELYKAIKLPHGQQPDIDRGKTYTVEILTGQGNRKFSYSDPVEHFLFYKENGVEVMAYRRFATFLKILEAELNL